MSVQQLRQRIMELDSEIDLQNQLLKKLHHDKVLVQRQLNEVSDLVARLPLEISSDIFIQSLAPFSKPGAHELPMLLLGICSTWNAIALATPALWTNIQIEFPCSDRLAEVLPMWFQRARNCPLSVSFHGDFYDWDHRVSATIWQCATQLKYLEISNDVYNDGEDYDSDVEVDVFGDTTVESLPLLETLVIHSVIENRRFSGSQILELLRLASNIVECRLGGTSYMYDVEDASLTLPTLRRLMFEGRMESDDEILNCLSLPALETLSMPVNNLNYDDLVRFFTRSAPLLRRLTLDWYPATSLGRLYECLHLIPSLVQFEMQSSDSEGVADLSIALANSPSLLPNLNSLTMHLKPHSPIFDTADFSSWRTLLGVVSSRRFHLRLLGVLDTVPPTDVLAAFRELVDDGVQIYAGTEERNLILA